MNSTASEVRGALAGAEYPASISDLLEVAEDAGASTEVLEDLRTLAQEEYDSLSDVVAELSEDD